MAGIATKLHKEEGDVQRDSLLYAMGRRQVNRTFRTLTFVAPEVDTDYETLVSKLTESFIPQRNVIHERCVFQNRQQLANESVDEFARELQTLVVHWEYKEQTNEMVRDRFVMGVRDQAVKQKLQLITDLNLDKAMIIAIQHEQVKLQKREQQLEQEQHVAEASVSPNPRTPGRYTKPKDGHTASKYRYSMSRDRLTRKCERCGYAEHLRGGSWPALGQRCNKYNAKGHFASACRSKRNTVNFERHKTYEVEREGTKP